MIIDDLQRQILELQQSKQSLERDLNILSNQIRIVNPFRLLKAYKIPGNTFFNDYPGAEPMYDKTYIGIKHNENYCDIVDTYNLHNADNIFHNMNFVGDYVPHSTSPLKLFIT